jgi:hypothetical protein
MIYGFANNFNSDTFYFYFSPVMSDARCYGTMNHLQGIIVPFGCRLHGFVFMLPDCSLSGIMNGLGLLL